MSIKRYELSDLFDRLKSGSISFSVDEHKGTYLLLRNFISSLGNPRTKRSEPEYLGELVDGQPEGLGVMAYDELWKFYVGEWRQGKPHGRGFMNFSLHQRYVGEWANGRRHGYGITVFEGRRMSVYYYEWKGQYVDDRWEGEDALEERERQKFPTTMHVGSDVWMAMRQFQEATETAGYTKQAFRIRSRIQALHNLERAFQIGWRILSHRYPKDFPELNRYILVQSHGLWCIKCSERLDPSEYRDELRVGHAREKLDVVNSPVENAFSSTLQYATRLLNRRRKISARARKLYEPGFDRRGEAYYTLEQQERFIHQYMILYQLDMSSWELGQCTLRYRFLEFYVKDRVSVIDQHLREVHDWQIAQGVSPDLELDVSNDPLDSLYN